MRLDRSRLLLSALLLLGVATVLRYFTWWLEGPRTPSVPLLLALGVAAAYYWVQLLIAWLLYWKARLRPATTASPPALTVDVFIPVYREPYDVVERALRAARGMALAPTIWLLDDGDDPALARLAHRLDVRYRRRAVPVDAKAGHVNAALADSCADVVVIFDVDHRPRPDFLLRTLPYLDDPRVGFVQVMLTFDNQDESWVARAAAESTVDFYNATSLGMDALGSATLVGSNAVIRTRALRDIGGYRSGLAEDLATSVALHAAGWRSVYTREPLAPGLAPADLTAWFAQQLKWARGVFEVALVDYPRLFPRLSWGQRLSYLVRGTYYLVGLLVASHLCFTIAYLLYGDGVARFDFPAYLDRFLPVVAATLLIRQYVVRHVGHPSMPTRVLWRPLVLVTATWPIYLLALALTLLRVPVAYRPTPKQPSRRLSIIWLLPQVTAALLIAVALLRSTASAAVVLFALAQLALQASVVVVAALECAPACRAVPARPLPSRPLAGRAGS